MSKRFNDAISSVVFVSLSVLGCSPEPQPTSDTKAADEAAIRQADIAWSRTGETKDLQAALEFYTEDPTPIMMPSNMPMAVGKEAILEVFRPMYDMPGFSVSWQPVEVEAASSGDIGYVRGIYEMTMNNPDGNPRTDNGKYIEIWKKQADGSWKVALEIFNSDLPATSSFE